MHLRKNLIFLFQFVTIGLALAFIVVYFYPELIGHQPTVVQLKESDTPITNTPPGEHMSSYATAVDKAAPAVVNIYTTKLIQERRSPLLDDPLFRHFFNKDSDNPGQRRETSLGASILLLICPPAHYRSSY